MEKQTSQIYSEVDIQLIGMFKANKQKGNKSTLSAYAVSYTHLTLPTTILV